MRKWIDTLRNQPNEAPNGLELLRPVVEPDPDAWQRIRQDFLREVREYSVEAVTLTQNSRHNDWRTRLSAFLSFDWRNRPMMVIVKAMLALALVVGGGSGTVYAMQNSLPGNPLYELKLDVEDLMLENAGDAEARLERAMSMARNRVEEALRLAEKGEEVPVQVAERYERSLAAALAAADELPEAVQLRARLLDELGEQLQKMEQVRNQLQEAGEDGDGALRTMTQTQQRLRDDQTPPEGDHDPLREQDRERLQEHQEIGEPGEAGTQNQQQTQQQEQLQSQQDAEPQQQNQTQPQNQNQNQNQNQTQSESETQPEPDPQNQNQGQGEQSEDSSPASPPASQGGNGQHE